MKRAHLLFLLLGLLPLGLVLAGCTGLAKLDYSELGSRAIWQQPDRVVESLNIPRGATVADIGTGAGYFLPYLVEAVGPEGRVFAVDVDPEIAEQLQTLVAEAGYDNVEIVLAEYDDPLLPDGQIDLVFLCNTYHHIEDRPAYFSRLLTDLSPHARVAILDPNADLTGVFRLFLDDGHMSSASALSGEMQAAGYRKTESFDFLPTQVFELFAAAGDAS